MADARPVVLLVIAPDDTTPPADSWVQVEGVLSSRELPGAVGLITITADCILSAAVPQNLIFAPALDGRARRGPRPSGGQRSVVTVRIALAVKIRPTTTMIRAAPI